MCASVYVCSECVCREAELRVCFAQFNSASANLLLGLFVGCVAVYKHSAVDVGQERDELMVLFGTGAL